VGDDDATLSACAGRRLLFANYRYVLLTFEHHFDPDVRITTTSSASFHPICSTTTFCLQDQHLHCPYQRRPFQCLAGGFHSSSCHCSLLSLYSISSAFPDGRSTRCRCSKSARAASNVSIPSQMVALMSFDVEGASARSLLLTSPARCLFRSPPPFRPIDEGAVSAIPDPNNIRRQKAQLQQWETMNGMPRRPCCGCSPWDLPTSYDHVHFRQDVDLGWESSVSPFIIFALFSDL
jgi:hypothetical protein